MAGGQNPKNDTEVKNSLITIIAASTPACSKNPEASGSLASDSTSLKTFTECATSVTAAKRN